jgi:hypothetical protein
MAIQQVVTVEIVLNGDNVATSFTYSFTKLFQLILDSGQIVNAGTLPSGATLNSVVGAIPAGGSASLDGFGNLVLTFSGAWLGQGTAFVALLFASGTLSGTTQAWTSATTANTTWTLPLAGSNSVLVPLVVTGTVTTGTITFTASADGATWFPIQGVVAAGGQALSSWNSALGNTVLLFNTVGFSYLRLTLTVVIAGTGIVTFIMRGSNAISGVLDTVINVPTISAGGALSGAIINATGAKTLVKGSTGNLYGVYFLNNTAVASWIQFFNSATVAGVTLGTTVPVWAAPIAASGILIIHPSTLALLNFTAGIVYAATSTLQGATAESMSGTVQYL